MPLLSPDDLEQIRGGAAAEASYGFGANRVLVLSRFYRNFLRNKDGLTKVDGVRAASPEEIAAPRLDRGAPIWMVTRMVGGLNQRTVLIDESA